MNTKLAFDAVGRVIKEQQITCLLVGGFAVNFYGFGRLTDDIDFLVVIDDYEKLRTSLEAMGYDAFEKTENYARLKNADQNSVGVDFLFVDGDTLAQMVKDGREIKFAGWNFRVPSLRHLIAMKLHAIRTGGLHRELKDLLDIATLVKEHKIDIASADFKKLCLQFGDKNIYQKLLLFFDR
jgi:predicted nucleotidyltransferase